MRLPRLVQCVALATLFSASTGYAGTSVSREMSELEIKAWTADDHELSELERRIVRVMQTTPESALAHHLLAHVLIRQFSRDPGDLFMLKQASDLAQQAIDLEPKSDAGYVAVAEVLDLMGNPDRALALLVEAENLGVKKSWRFAFTRSRLAGGEASTEKILGFLDEALSYPDAEPRIVAPYVVALLAAENKGDLLIAKLESWNAKFPSPLFEMTAAINHAELGRTARASEIYSRLEAANPDYKEAQINHGILLYRDLKDDKRAVTLLSGVLAKHGAMMSGNMTAMVNAHLGAARIDLKDFPKAATAFVEALRADAGNLAIVDFMTKAYREKKLHKELAVLLRKVNDELPGNGVTYALLGETLSESLADHDGAVRAFGDAIALDPSRSDYFNGLGLVYYRKKSYPEALKSFGAATQVDPQDATARYNQACVLALMGRGPEALDSLGEALALDPRLAVNAKSDADFAGLKLMNQFQQMVQQPGVKSSPYEGVAH